MVGHGANATDPLGDAGHLFYRTPLAKALEPAKLGHLEIGVGHIALVIQEYRDLSVPLQAGDGIDGYAFHDAFSPFRCESHTWPDSSRPILI
jgi:hypothetical protein